MTKPMRLVNLTSHDVVVDVEHVGPRGSEERLPSPARIAAAGGMARVREQVVVRAQLPTEHGAITEIALRRSDDIDGLPSPANGVAYVVPRLTAQAARGRADLYFPYDERRDDQGHVVSVRALGRFTPDRRRLRQRSSLAQSWWERQVSDVSRLARAVAVAFAAATALLGGALGFLPDIVAARWGSHRLWLWFVGSVVLVTLAVAAVALGLRLWARGQRILNERGTAYIIEERAEGWTYEEKRSFLADLEREFATVLRVPGPADLGEDWHWSLGDDASRWSEKVDAVVRAFWSVQFNDDQRTDNSVFVWAWWPVALGFAGRAVSGRRGLVLRVRRRPSRGREGILDIEAGREPPIEFVRDPAARRLGSAEPPWNALARVVSTGSPAESVTSAGRPVTLLLLRMSRGRWGPVPPVGAQRSHPIELEIVDPSGRTGLVGSVDVQVREWWCVPDPGRLHSWDVYQPLAQSATDWIGEVAREDGGVLLLGMLTMQEVAVGMGVLAAHGPKEGWPGQLWPVVWDEDAKHFVIPGLDLGWSSLHRQVWG